MNDPIAAIVIIAIIAVLAYVFMRDKKKKAKNQPKSGWHIGPEIRGENYSPGMPARPTPQGDGWHFDFPTRPDHHVHYVALRPAPDLIGPHDLKVQFRVTGGPFVPQEFPDRQATVSLLIQRKGDDWSAQGPMQSYRWFSKLATPLEPGTYVMEVPLEVEHWGDVNGGQNEVAFLEALRHADNIALVFGSAGGRGHGVYGPGRFEMLWLELV